MFKRNSFLTKGFDLIVWRQIRKFILRRTRFLSGSSRAQLFLGEVMFREFFFRPLIVAGLFSASCGSAAALSAKVTVSPQPASLVGTVTIRDLAAGPAAPPAARAPVEMPRPRVPNGSPTLERSMPQPGALPFLPPNIKVAPSPGEANAAPLTGVISMRGFSGIHSKDDMTVNGFPAEPPDQGLAVNNNVAAEINNVVLRFFNASSGAPLTGPISLGSIFGADPFFLTGPQAFYDSSTGRWFFTVADSNSQFFYIAVSATGDPLGKYFIYRVDAFSADLPLCQGADCSANYPHVGYDKNGLYISANLFSITPRPIYAGAATYALPLAKIEAGENFTFVRILYPGDFTVQPSVPAPGEPSENAANGTEFLLEARNLVDQTHKIRVWAISNTNNIISRPASLRAFAADVPAEAYGLVVPAAEPNLPGPFCKSHGITSAPFLDAVFNVFQSTIQKASGRLYGVLPLGSADSSGLVRDSLAWFALKASVDAGGYLSASIFKQGYVVPPTGYSLLNPALGLDKSGAGFLGFTITNRSKDLPGGFPSAALIQFTGEASAGSIVVSGQGIAADDGYTGCTASQPGSQIGAWGTYGAATVDPATGFFYVANENISGARTPATNWGTFITQIMSSPPHAAAKR